MLYAFWYRTRTMDRRTTEEEHYAGVVQPVAEPPKKEVAQEITKSLLALQRVS